MPDSTSRDRLVQSQYEAYPYPERDPADESKRLITGSPSQFNEVNHYIFGATCQTLPGTGRGWRHW